MLNVILASGSPRRRELMESLNIPFSVEALNIDETINEKGDLVSEIENLSFKKALAVFKKHPDSLVIGADTIVTMDNEVLGKPLDQEKAKAMLRKIAGRTHEVITGVSLISQKQSETFSVVSRVSFYPMDEEEIAAYAATLEPLDKAGSYAIQGYGARYIKRLNGDYYAVMGLPVGELYHRIKKYLAS